MNETRNYVQALGLGEQEQMQGPVVVILFRRRKNAYNEEIAFVVLKKVTWYHD